MLSPIPFRNATAASFAPLVVPSLATVGMRRNVWKRAITASSDKDNAAGVVTVGIDDDDEELAAAAGAAGAAAVAAAAAGAALLATWLNAPHLAQGTDVAAAATRTFCVLLAPQLLQRHSDASTPADTTGTALMTRRGERECERSREK